MHIHQFPKICYDPSLLLRFKKQTSIEEYKDCCDSNKQFYEDIVNTKLSDFQPNGRKRVDLCIPLVQGIAEMGTNEDFKKELNEYLKSIQYDESQVYEELNQVFQKCLMTETRKI